MKMLYYRLYKRMKQKMGNKPNAFIPLDYGLFAIILPMIVGSMIGMILERMGMVSEASGFLIMILSIAAAATYIQVCERNDKGR